MYMVADLCSTVFKHSLSFIVRCNGPHVTCGRKVTTTPFNIVVDVNKLLVQHADEVISYHCVALLCHVHDMYMFLWKKQGQCHTGKKTGPVSHISADQEPAGNAAQQNSLSEHKGFESFCTSSARDISGDDSVSCAKR